MTSLLAGFPLRLIRDARFTPSAVGRQRWPARGVKRRRESKFSKLHAFTRLLMDREHRADIHVALLQFACSLARPAFTNPGAP
jgi:hypothetical protein